MRNTNGMSHQSKTFLYENDEIFVGRCKCLMVSILWSLIPAFSPHFRPTWRIFRPGRKPPLRAFQLGDKTSRLLAVPCMAHCPYRRQTCRPWPPFERPRRKSRVREKGQGTQHLHCHSSWPDRRNLPVASVQAPLSPRKQGTIHSWALSLSPFLTCRFASVSSTKTWPPGHLPFDLLRFSFFRDRTGS